MKKILIIGIALFLLTCSKSDDDMNTIQEEKTIVGNWKLIEIFTGYDNIYSNHWYSEELNVNNDSDPFLWTVANGYTYSFKANGVFETDRGDDCVGEYIINDDIISISDCDELAPNLNQIYGFALSDGYLELYADPEYFCIEGCTGIFIRIDDTNN